MNPMYRYFAPAVLLGLAVGCGQPAAPTKKAAAPAAPDSTAASESQVTLHVAGMV